MKITTFEGKNKYTQILSYRDDMLYAFNKYINNVMLCFEEIEDLMEYDVENCELSENDELSNCDQFWKGYERIGTSISDCIYSLDEDVVAEDLSSKSITVDDLTTLQELVKRYISLFEQTQKGLNKRHKQIINLKDMIFNAVGKSEEEIEDISGWNEDESENCAVEILRILKKSELNIKEMNEFVESSNQFAQLRNAFNELQMDIQSKNSKR